MAGMYPEEIKGYEKATEGEKEVFDFSGKRQGLTRITVAGMNRRSVSSRGNLILSCFQRDWASPQILAYTPHRFTVRISSKPEKKTNPSRQAKGYVHALMDKLNKIHDFLSDNGPNRIRLEVNLETLPLDCGSIC